MKKTLSLTIILVASILFVTAVSAQLSTSAAQSSKGKKADASALYQQQCAKCHSADGKGIESLKGADIPDFTDAKWQAAHTDKEITEAINNGKGIMPGFKDAISAEETSALVKHVRSFAAGAAKSKKKKLNPRRKNRVSLLLAAGSDQLIR